jgi:hypothetical protein
MTIPPPPAKGGAVSGVETEFSAPETLPQIGFVQGHRYKRSIKLLYWRGFNFGDLLNIELAKHLGIDVEYASQKYAEAVFVGSMLQQFLSKKCWLRRARYLLRSPVKVWGTGFLYAPKRGEKLFRRLGLHAVRGQKTLEALRELTDRKLESVVLGDPGLLASRLFDASEIKKIYALGIVPHMVDKNSPALAKIKIRNARIIDIQQTPADFLAQVAECENILSSALHGLIAADSLGIPNIRIIISDNIEGGDWKYDDYYSAFGIENHARIDLREIDAFDDIGSIERNYRITPEQIGQISDNLLAVFPYIGVTRSIEQLKKAPRR